MPRRIGRSFDGRQHRLGDDARFGPQRPLSPRSAALCRPAAVRRLPAITTTDGRQMRICRTRYASSRSSAWPSFARFQSSTSPPARKPHARLAHRKLPGRFGRAAAGAERRLVGRVGQIGLAASASLAARVTISIVLKYPSSPDNWASSSQGTSAAWA